VAKGRKAQATIKLHEGFFAPALTRILRRVFFQFGTLRVKEVEPASDAWGRFEGAVDVVAKRPPQHRTKKKQKSKRKKKR
jgi:hypothetical protein